MKNKVVFLIDRSGSMANCVSDFEPAINTLFKSFAKDNVSLSVYDFDTVLEKKFSGDINEQIVPEYKLVPRGGTALNDAACTVIDEIGVELANLPTNSRPEKILFYIITDGEENSSKKYTKADVKSRLEHQESVYNWKFSYLGADHDAFAESASIGTNPVRATGFRKDKLENVASAVYTSASRYMSGVDAELQYNEQERKAIS